MRRVVILTLALWIGCDKQSTPSKTTEPPADPAPERSDTEVADPKPTSAAATPPQKSGPIADAATRHLPDNAYFVVRFASLDRLAEWDKKLELLWTLVDDHRSLSAKLLPRGTERLPIDPAKPFYLTVTEARPSWLFHATRGATLDRDVRVGRHMTARLVDGMIRLGPAAAVDRPRRKQPLTVLAGDVSIAAAVAEFASTMTGQLEQARRALDEFDFDGLPIRIAPGAIKLLRALAEVAMTILEGTDSAHYALTWRGDRVHSEAWIRTLPGSTLRRFLSSPAKPSTHRLIGYLPRDAFLAVDSCGLGSWLDQRVAGMLDAEFGKGAGADLLMLLAPSYGLAPHLNGRGAGAISTKGMMDVRMQSVWEVKPGAPIHDAIDALDAKRINQRADLLGIPAGIRIERNVDAVGATKIHRITYHSTFAAAATMLPQLQTCFAVEGRYLLAVQSKTAAEDIKALIARIRAGAPGDHPHLDAMARLGPTRHEGLTLNMGALEPLLLALGALVPGGAKIVEALPEEIYLSTALTLQDGHLHLRGDWPVLEVLRFAASLK